MTKVNIKEQTTRYFYHLHFRYTLKSFPKNITENQYKARLLKKLKVPAKYDVYGPDHSKGRGTISVCYVPEREANRLCKRAEEIDDGVLREVQREFGKAERVWE